MQLIFLVTVCTFQIYLSHPAHQVFDKMSVRNFQRHVLPSFKTYPTRSFSTIPGTNKLGKQTSPSKSGSRLSELKTPKNYGSVASFLKDSGFSSTHLGLIKKTAPNVFSSKLEQTIKPKINILKNMGLSTAQIADVISSFPRILYGHSDHCIERAVLTMKKVLGDKFYDDARILKNFGWFMNTDLEKTVVPNVKFMQSCGIEESQIMQLFYNYPMFLQHKTENFKEFVRRADGMGVDRESKLYVHAIKTLGSMSLETWEQKLDVFRELGFTEVEILSIFKRFPNVYCLSERNIKETAEFLLNSGKYDRSFLYKYPYSLSFSLERRIKPRSHVLDILERRKILKSKLISSAFTIPDNKFFVKFVRPYLNEIEELSSVYFVNRGVCPPPARGNAQ